MTAAEAAIAAPSWRRRRPVLARLLGHRLFLFGAALFGTMAALAIFADLLAVAPPERMHFRFRFRTPEWAFPLGTDNFGRDLWSRLVYGARLSLAIGLAVTIVTGVAGTAIGLAAGYWRRLDDPLMRVMDALMAFPAILLAIAIAAALGPSALNAVIALSAVYTPRTARIVRSTVLVLREIDFVQAARAVGARDSRIVFRHILPNCLAPLIVQLTFIFGYAILAESILSFLGLGPPPPTPTWGAMIAEGKDYLREAPLMALFPGLAIAVTALGLNLLGDGLRDAVDPRLKVQQS